jgi:hypothetical protein
MIKTYDEALKTLNDVRKYLDINRADDCVEELDKVARYFINEKHSQPTLSECIKEWEEREWTVDELKQFPVIKIWKLNQEQCVVDNIYIFNKTLTSKIDFDADYETLNLLTKTLKALEVEDEYSKIYDKKN